MKDSIRKKLEAMTQRYMHLSDQLGSPEVINNQNKLRDMSKEFSQLEPVVKAYRTYTEAEASLEEAHAMLEDDDASMYDLAKEEIAHNKAVIERLDDDIKILLLPKDKNDDRNIFLEIRAGTGGDEAAIFVGDLFRMYSRYAEIRGWRLEVMNANEGEHGGYKEIIAKVSGQDVYGHLKFESGAHRVQRVPETESQGRVHTSACTVAVLPEAEEIDEVEINPADLKVDTFRASGAGGQHVNVTDSAIRITHIPTGIVVECQDERSQHKNRARAMSVLSAKILSVQQEKQRQEEAQTRKSLVGSGDRSERIRTYNFPQGRMTDHRINLTLYKLGEIMEGALDQLIDPLIAEHQAELLAHFES